MKTLTSQGTPGEMVAIGRTTAGARVKGGKQWGDVACRNDQGRGHRGTRTDDDGSGVWSGDDYQNIVVRCVWETNRRKRLSGFGDSQRRKWKGWDRWQFLLSTYVANNGGRRGGLRSTTHLNKERLKLLNDIRCNKFVEYMVATGL